MSMIKIATFPVTGGTSTPFWVEECALTNLAIRPACPYPGLVADTYKFWLHYLGSPYQLIPQLDANLGEFKNETWNNGLFAKLQNKEIDFIMDFWAQQPTRREFFDFGFPTMTYNMVFATKAGQLSFTGSAWLLVKVYASWTWFFLIIALLLCQITISAAQWVPAIGSRKALTNFLFVIYSLTLIFFFGTYQNGLLSHLLHTPTQDLFQDPWHLADMIEKQEVKLIVQSEAEFRYQTLLHSNETFVKRLRKAIERNPVMFEGNLSKALEKVMDGKHVLLGTEHEVMIMSIENCGIKSVRTKELPQFQASMMTWKGNPWLPKFDKIVVQVSTLTEHISNRYWQMWKVKQAENCWKEEGIKPLSFWSLSGAFVALGFTAVVGCLCLLAEKLTKSLNEKISLALRPMDCL